MRQVSNQSAPQRKYLTQKDFQNEILVSNKIFYKRNNCSNTILLCLFWEGKSKDPSKAARKKKKKKGKEKNEKTCNLGIPPVPFRQINYLAKSKRAKAKLQSDSAPGPSRPLTRSQGLPDIVESAGTTVLTEWTCFFFERKKQTLFFE